LERPGCTAPPAQAVKKHASLPVIAAGRISAPTPAEWIIEKERADLIGLARMLRTDPLWVKRHDRAARGGHRDVQARVRRLHGARH
jgi:NADPH2 dehydrogenase